MIGTMTKALRFASSPPTEYKSTLYSVEEIMEAVWYSPSEVEAMIQRCKLVAMGKMKDMDSDGCSSSSRGLELVSGGSNKNTRHRSIVNDILAEQARQIQETGFLDVESLGRFASAACSHRQRLAEIRGKQDEMEASDSSSAWSIGSSSSSSSSNRASPIIVSPKTSSKTIDQQGGEDKKVARRQARRRMGRTRPQPPARTASGGRSLKHEQ